MAEYCDAPYVTDDNGIFKRLTRDEYLKLDPAFRKASVYYMPEETLAEMWQKGLSKGSPEWSQAEKDHKNTQGLGN